MSIQAISNKKPICPLDVSPFVRSDQDKAGLFERWMRCIHTGQLAERLSSQKYCERVWTQQTGTSATRAAEDFMEPCRASHEAFMQLVRWSRVN